MQDFRNYEAAYGPYIDSESPESLLSFFNGEAAGDGNITLDEFLCKKLRLRSS